MFFSILRYALYGVWLTDYSSVNYMGKYDLANPRGLRMQQVLWVAVITAITLNIKILGI